MSNTIWALFPRNFHKGKRRGHSKYKPASSWGAKPFLFKMTKKRKETHRG